MSLSFKTLEKVIPARNRRVSSSSFQEEEENDSDASFGEENQGAESDALSSVPLEGTNEENMYLAQAYRWRLAAMAEGVALIVMIVGLVYVAGEDRLMPYVVEIGPGESSVIGYSARQASTISLDVVKAQLTNFIVNARGVLADPVLQKHSIDAAYGMVIGDARDYLGSWYATPGQSPYELEQKETDEIRVTSVTPIAPPSYQVTWTETIRGGGTGKERVPDSTENWAATISISFRAQSDEGSILRNPLGLYITSINWAKQL